MKCLQTGRLRALISPHVSAFDFPTSPLSLEEGRKLVSSFPFHLLHPPRSQQEHRIPKETFGSSPNYTMW